MYISCMYKHLYLLAVWFYSKIAIYTRRSSLYLYLILIALLLVYTSDRIRVLFFSDDPSNHVWKITCRKEYEYAQQRCPKKYILIRLFATSDNEIEGLDNGLKQLGLTYLGSIQWYVQTEQVGNAVRQLSSC